MSLRASASLAAQLLLVYLAAATAAAAVSQQAADSGPADGRDRSGKSLHGRQITARVHYRAGIGAPLTSAAEHHSHMRMLAAFKV